MMWWSRKWFWAGRTEPSPRWSGLTMWDTVYV